MRRKPRVYENGPVAAQRFDKAMGRILAISKPELDRREAEYQESIKDRPKRGRKPVVAKR
jgi:hypothetical protein